MTLAQPLVSVIAICYNHEDFLVECLNSIRAQTFTDYELLIYDDHSQDRSIEIITKWISDTGTPCLLTVHDNNSGLCKTLNEALRIAKGQYITIISTDDVLLPHKLDVQVRALERAHENVGVVFSDAYIMSEDGHVDAEPYTTPFRERWKTIPDGDIYEQLLLANFIPAPTALIRSVCYKTVGMYDETLAYEDRDMWLRIAQHYHFLFLEDCLVQYRIVAGSLYRTLIGEKDASRLKSEYLLFLKHANSVRLTSKTKRIVARKLAHNAEELYALKHQRSTWFLVYAFKCAPALRTLTLLVLSIVGMPYSSFKTAERRLSKITSYIRWRLD